MTGALLARGVIDRVAAVALQHYGRAIFGYLPALLEEDHAQDVFSVFAEHLGRGLPGFREEGSLRLLVLPARLDGRRAVPA